MKVKSRFTHFDPGVENWIKTYYYPMYQTTYWSNMTRYYMSPCNSRVAGYVPTPECLLTRHQLTRDAAFGTVHHRTNGYDFVGTEKIAYTQRGYDRVNDCIHTKTYGHNHAYTAFMPRYNIPGYWINPAYWRDPSSVETPDTAKEHTQMSQLVRNRAWATMQPEFEGNISMLNFLYELKDFKSILKVMAKHPSNTLSKLSGAFRKWKRTADYRKYDISRPMAEGWLVNEFAIKPLVSDIINIHQQLKLLVEDAQTQFQLDGMQNNTRHYTEVVPVVESLSPYWYFSGKLGTYNRTIFTATLDYNYAYSMRSDFDAFCKYWGFGLTAEAIWNGIPFSFLADYFNNIGETLHIMHRDPNVSMKTLGYCESMTTLNQIGYFIDPGLSMGGVILNDRHITTGGWRLTSGQTSKLYSRIATEPSTGTVLPVFSLASKRQLVNIAALVRCIL